MTPEEAHKIQLTMKGRPHLVILGAGATIAAIPNGDRNGRKSSVMDGFLEKLGMSDAIAKINLVTKSGNLEDIYTEIHERTDCDAVRAALDQRIRDYFSGLELPDDANIYDLILLSLRKKDLVATFNWDPLLLQAYQRAARITNDLPDLAFLHGNVIIGSCDKDKIGGIISVICPECGDNFRPGRLLYPIRKKNYSEDPYIRDNWKALRIALKKAYLVTIFGYSAPKTDEEAISVMKSSWGNSENRSLEEFEFIDIKTEDEIADTWKDFIHTHHYNVYHNFFSSSLAKFPRRTTVELFDRTMECKFTKPTYEFKPNMNWLEVETVVKNLVAEEERLGESEFLTVSYS